MNVLFVTWDGDKSNFLENLFLPIFSKLDGVNFEVLQFTWATDATVANNREACARLGIGYKSISIINKPFKALGSLVTALNGSRILSKKITESKIDIVIARSTLPALSTLLALKNRGQIKFIFDADGFPIDERVDFGYLKTSSIQYRILRDIEAQAVRIADKVIVRTSESIDVLISRAGPGVCESKFGIVCNGRDSNTADSDIIRAEIRREINVGDSDPIILFLGTIRSERSFNSAISLFKAILNKLPSSKFMVLTPNIDTAENIIKRDAEIDGKVILKTVEFSQVPRYLAAVDLGVAILEKTFSTKGIAPIKLGEYLMSGIPVVATRGIGNTRTLENNVAFLIDNDSEIDLQEASDWFANNFEMSNFNREEISEIGRQHFSIERSVDDYKIIINSVKK